MRLYHGTSAKLIPSIEENGLLMSPREELNGEFSVCAMDNLPAACGVAAYFGRDGVVVEFTAPKVELQFHPDYGHGPEFDTIHVMSDVPPERIAKIHKAPANLRGLPPRPLGVQLREWKARLPASTRLEFDRIAKSASEK